MSIRPSPHFSLIEGQFDTLTRWTTPSKTSTATQILECPRYHKQDPNNMPWEVDVSMDSNKSERGSSVARRPCLDNRCGPM